MRYESFYPFSQSRANEFFNFSNAAPVNPPMPIQPSPPEVIGPLSNFGANFASAFNSAPSPAPGPPPNNPFGGFQQQGPGPGPAPVPSRAMSYLQTADKFINTAQQFTPMVKQLSPMFQNVPALWRLYKGFQGMPAVAASAAPSIAAASTTARAASPIISSGLSIPRIFQPPI